MGTGSANDICSRPGRQEQTQRSARAYDTRGLMLNPRPLQRLTSAPAARSPSEAMKKALLFLATALPFLLLDLIMINWVVTPMFQRNIPQLLLASPKIAVVVVWYVLYISGVVYFAVLPALQRDKPALAVLNGGALGLLAYSTYEMTNLATLKSWTWQMSASDTLWGTVLSAVSAYAGATISKKLAPTDFDLPSGSEPLV